MIRVLPLLLLLMSFWGSSIAQTSVYDTRVRTINGERLVGTLTEVTGTTLFIDGSSVPLQNVKKIVLSRVDKGGGVWPGAVIGGLGIGYLTNRSLQKEQVSNNLLYGVSLMMGVVAGAAIGAIAGNTVNKLSRAGRVVFRPRAGAESVESLSRQLKPFSRTYQEDLLNNVPNPMNQ